MIRQYQPSDRKILTEIFILNTPKYFDLRELNDFLEYLKKHGETYMTIEHESKIVGGTGYYVKDSDKSGRITWIFFHPDYSGLGMGKHAVEYCLRRLREDPRVEKFVVTTSQFAFRFFEKFGYELTKTEKDFWGVGLDLYEMEMPKNKLPSS